MLAVRFRLVLKEFCFLFRNGWRFCIYPVILLPKEACVLVCFKSEFGLVWSLGWWPVVRKLSDSSSFSFFLCLLTA